jgi:hypothetical protein
VKLIYMDESGHTGTDKNADQPLHYLAAVCIDEQKVRAVEREIQTIAFTALGAVANNTDFEFKGHGLRSGKGRYFTGLPTAKRIELVAELLALLKKHDIRVIWAAVDKAKSLAKLHPQQLCFLLVVERVEQWLRKQDIAGGPLTLGLLVADEFDELEQRLIDDLNRYKDNCVDFGFKLKPVERVIDLVHFVRSFNNPLIQLADLVAYFLNRGNPTRKRLMPVWRGEPAGSANFKGWCAEHAKPAEQADLRFLEIIQPAVVASKVFP